MLLPITLLINFCLSNNTFSKKYLTEAALRRGKVPKNVVPKKIYTSAFKIYTSAFKIYTSTFKIYTSAFKILKVGVFKNNKESIINNKILNEYILYYFGMYLFYYF